MIKLNRVIPALYIFAALFVLIPIVIAVFSGKGYRSYFSSTVISASMLFFIIGKTLTVIQKSKENKGIWGDIGAIVAVLLMLVANWL